jgi:hypothetical protein
MTDSIKDHVSNAWQWAVSGTKITYAALGVGLLIGFIMFRLFFRNVSGLFHSIGFSLGAGGNPAVAAEPGLSTTSRLKLLLILVIPAACAYLAYTLLPTIFPTVFQVTP